MDQVDIDLKTINPAGFWVEIKRIRFGFTVPISKDAESRHEKDLPRSASLCQNRFQTAYHVAQQTNLKDVHL